MLTLDYIRENLTQVKKAAQLKNRPVDFAKLLKLDEEYRANLNEINLLRQKRNQLAKTGKNSQNISEGRELKTKLKKVEETNLIIKSELDKILLAIPNVPYAEVPEGQDESGNVEVKKVGKPKQFDFQPLSHLSLIEKYDLADLTRGAKVAGYRGYFLKGKLATLHLAVLFYVFQKLSQKGYTPFIAPSIVKEFPFFGSGQFPWGKDEVYHLEKDDLYLAGTAEVPITAYYADEILSEKELPKKFIAFSPCFRREIGNYGKDTKGLYRVHEFWKVEQVIIAENNDQKARAYHEELLKNSEEILQDLELPYRVLLMCTGDMGEPQAKKYDLEIWMPYRNGYGEIASNSIMTDFQARRLKIRYRNKNGEIKTCYTLNDTAIPSPRVLIGILENHQQKDGSIKIPKVLQTLCGFKEIGK